MPSVHDEAMPVQIHTTKRLTASLNGPSGCTGRGRLKNKVQELEVLYIKFQGRFLTGEVIWEKILDKQITATYENRMLVYTGVRFS